VKGFPYGVAVDAEGNIWFVQHIGNAIGVLYRNNYTVKDYRIPTPDSNTQWLAIDSSGNVWFAESAGNAIGVLGTVQGEVEVIRADPYFTNVIIVSTVALIGLAVVVVNLAQRRLRYSIKLAGRAGGP
jgi:streptogramin lyase